MLSSFCPKSLLCYLDAKDKKDKGLKCDDDDWKPHLYYQYPDSDVEEDDDEYEDIGLESNDPNREDDSRMYDLVVSIQENRQKTAKKILATDKHHPLKINETFDGLGDINFTALHYAVRHSLPSIVSIILAHPDVDVNMADSNNATALFDACSETKDDDPGMLIILLSDPRVRVDIVETWDNLNILCRTACVGDEAIHQLQAMVAYRSYDELGIDKRANFHDFLSREITNEPITVLEMARYCKFNGLVNFFEKCKTYPLQTKHECEVLYKLSDALSTQIYATVVLASDGYLKINPPLTEKECDTVRFLKMATRLPLELQMILCNRMFGINKDTITSKHSFPAFCYLASLYPKK